MKKTLLTFIIGGFLGFVVGSGFMLIAFPYLFLNEAANETVTSANVDSLLVETMFRDEAEGQDAGHWGRGGLKVYRATDGDIILELQKDFEVGPGPNFWLYTNTVADVNLENDFLKDSGRIKLTKLKNFKGSQVYRITEKDYSEAKSITIWCESFNQYIASANL